MTNNSILLLFAIVNVAVTGLFAGVVLRQYLQRRRASQLYWSIALIMAFLATLAYVLMVIVGPTSSAGIMFFRIYYILGAALECVERTGDSAHLQCHHQYFQP